MKAGFWEEFAQLQTMEYLDQNTRYEGSRPENKAKNRYKNILPCEETESRRTSKRKERQKKKK